MILLAIRSSEDGEENQPRAKVKCKRARLEGDFKKKVFVENLNFKTSWQQLKDHMREAGTVERTDIFTKKSGLSKGCGYALCNFLFISLQIGGIFDRRGG